MDAYIDYVMRVSDNRLEDLRREAAHRRLVRALVTRRSRLGRRRQRATPAMPMPLPVRPAAEAPLRRIA